MHPHVASLASTRQQRNAPAPRRFDSTLPSADASARLSVRHFALKGLTALGMLAAVLACASSADARSRQMDGRGSAFDGQWSVVIQTERGACDSYRVGIDIVNGAVTYDGSAYGRVSGTGAVRVGGSMAGEKAQGAGRLSRASGQGVWRASGKLGPCSGHWMAERRG